MKLAMMTYTMWRGPWGKNPDALSLCKLTSELGLTAIDWCSNHGLDPADICAIMDDLGLSTACYTFGANDIASTVPSLRKAGLENVERELAMAASLRSKIAMLVLGGESKPPREITRKYAIESLAKVIEIAKPLGITVTTEHFPSPDAPFVVSADFSEALAELPELKITYDNGNVLTGGESSEDAFTRSSTRIVHAHFKDWEIGKPGDGVPGLDHRWYKGARHGEGIVDTRASLAAMRAADYNGFIDIEYEGNKYTPEQAITKAVAYLTPLID